MRRITRYIFNQLTVGMVLVSCGLAGVIWLTQSLRFVESIVNRGLSASTFLYLTILLVPNFLTIVMPIAIFTVVLFVYSKLNSDREIVVMRAAGVSPLSVARPALVLALLVTAVTYALTFYIMPKSYQSFRDLQWDLRYSYSHVLLQEGVFNIISKDVTVFFRQRAGNGELKGILIQDDRDRDKGTTIVAERGALVETENGARVIMFDGNRQEITRTTNKLTLLYFDRYSFDLGGGSAKPALRYREARERMVDELLTLKKSDVGNPKDYGKFVVEGHQRIVTPLTVLAYTLIALICLLSGEFSRRGQTRRIIFAVIVVVVLQVSGLGLVNLATKNLGLVPLLYANTVAPIIVAYFLLLFMPRWRWRARAMAEDTA